MFVGRINGEWAGVSMAIGLTGDAGLEVHATTTSTNSRSASRVVEVCTSLKKPFFWYAQNLMGGLTVCGIVPHAFSGIPALGWVWTMLIIVVNAEARKTLENAAESHQSSARFV
ncbi:MAG: hypothetical protein ACMG55_17320, partial [Microcoleus sp.]